MLRKMGEDNEKIRIFLFILEKGVEKRRKEEKSFPSIFRFYKIKIPFYLSDVYTYYAFIEKV